MKSDGPDVRLHLEALKREKSSNGPVSLSVNLEWQRFFEESGKVGTAADTAKRCQEYLYGVICCQVGTYPAPCPGV